MALVLISGGMGSGKTTLANRLEAEWMLERNSLAAPLKAMVGEWYGIHPDDINLSEVKNNIRPTLQAVGQYYRAMNEDYWCYQTGPNLPYDSCLDDVRFENEVDYFRSDGGREMHGDVVHVHLYTSENYAIEFAQYRGAPESKARQMTSEVSESEARALYLKDCDLAVFADDGLWTPGRDEEIYKAVFDFLFDEAHLTPIG